MRYKPFLPLFILPVLILHSCMFCLEGEGPVMVEERVPAEFYDLEVKGSSDVRLHYAEEAFIEITAQENLLDNFVTDVQNGKLTIYAEECYRSKEPIKILVGTNRLQSIKLSGSGSLIGADPFTAESIFLHVSGSGDIKLNVLAEEVKAEVRGSGDILLEGECETFTAHVSGSGDIRAAALEARHVVASVAGSGDAKVNASESLDAKVNGSGDIRYMGNPQDLETKVNGSGDIRKMR